MINGITCCKDCKERHHGCHAGCETYINEKKQYEEFKEYLAREKEQFNGRMRVMNTLRSRYERPYRY